MVATAAPPSPHKTPIGVVTVPLRTARTVITEMADQMDGVSEGRSVAVEEPVNRPSPIRLKQIVVSAVGENLAKLEELNGREFDKFYKTTQHDALLQLSTLYALYIQRGDDAALRALAIRELPKVNERLLTVQII